MVDTVYFDPALGGNGKTITNDSNATTGMGNGGHRRDDGSGFVGALGQVVVMAGTATTKAGQAATSASNAATSATNAANSAAAAEAVVLNGAAIIPVWVSGTSFALGQTVLSASNEKTYRKITATSVTTIDPASDATNWQPLPVASLTKATTNQAQTATDDTAYMTPLKVNESLQDGANLEILHAVALYF